MSLPLTRHFVHYAAMGPLRHTRRIVPATGFYEPDKINFKKAPFPWHYFQLKEQKIFGFVDLYDTWTDKEIGKEIRSYTIITTKPNAIVGKYHDRMPGALRNS
jgi:putative SOS response-associated peptidase YedK